MEERHITKEEIEAILNEDVFSIIVPSKKEKEVNLILAKVGEKTLMIAVNKETKKLITVRPMREDEKRLFKEVLP